MPCKAWRLIEAPSGIWLGTLDGSIPEEFIVNVAQTLGKNLASCHEIIISRENDGEWVEQCTVTF